MARSIILDIFSGRYEGAGMPPPKTKSYKTNARKASDYHTELVGHLSPSDKELFEKFLDANERVTSETIDHFFREGFSLAFRLVFDSVSANIEDDDYEEEQE